MSINRRKRSGKMKRGLTHTHIYVFVCVCAFVCMCRNRTHIHMCMRVCVCGHACMYLYKEMAQKDGNDTQTCVCVCVCVKIGHIHIHMCVCMRVFVCVYLRERSTERNWICISIQESLETLKSFYYIFKSKRCFFSLRRFHFSIKLVSKKTISTHTLSLCICLSLSLFFNEILLARVFLTRPKRTTWIHSTGCLN